MEIHSTAFEKYVNKQREKHLAEFKRHIDKSDTTTNLNEDSPKEAPHKECFTTGPEF